MARSRSRRRVFLLFLLLLVLAGYALYTPDIDPAVLKENYASVSSQFLKLANGARAHVRDEGRRDGQALVLLHGSNASLQTFEPWVALLASEFRVVSLDLPGHGLTGRVPGDDYSTDGMAAFVDEVTTLLEVPHFALAGNSMGGRVAWTYALKVPARVDRLILIAAGGYPDDRPPPLAFRLARTPGLRTLMKWVTPRSLIEASLKDAIADDALVTGPMVTRYHELLLREGSREAAGIRFRLPGDPAAVGAVKSISVPTLILWGSADTFVPVAHAHLFQRDIPGSTLRIYEGVGHIPMEEIPERSAADVRAFLRGEI